MTTIIIVTIFLASVIGLGLFLRALRTRGFKTKTNPMEASLSQPKPSGEEEFKLVLDSLLATNLLIRKDREISEDLLLNLEMIIDNLKTVIPDMMNRYPGETLTYELKKIGSSHLQKIVKEFLDLSPVSRQAQMEHFNETVKSLQEVVYRAREIVERNETQEFKTMAQFLGQKFS